MGKDGVHSYLISWFKKIHMLYERSASLNTQSDPPCWRLTLVIFFLYTRLSTVSLQCFMNACSSQHMHTYSSFCCFLHTRPRLACYHHAILQICSRAAPLSLLRHLSRLHFCLALSSPLFTAPSSFFSHYRKHTRSGTSKCVHEIVHSTLFHTATAGFLILIHAVTHRESA